MNAGASGVLRDEVHAEYIGDTFTAVVHAMSRASTRTMLVEFRAPGGGALPAFTAGDHVDVRVGGALRQYSLLNDPAERHRYQICVLREEPSRGGSAYVHEQLRVGELVELSLPRSTFVLAAADAAGGGADAAAGGATGPVLLVAGGVGITPLLSMAAQLHRDGREFELHCWAASAAELPLGELLPTLAFADRIRVHLSAEGESLRTVVPEALAAPVASAVYACGPEGFLENVRAALARAGVEDRLRVEHFHRTLEAVAGGEFTVVAASTGQAMAVGETETIAEVLLRNGYPVELSCEVGICGSCITPVLAGVPDHRDEVQTDAEHAANDRVNVCCSRALTPVLELDL